MQEKANTIKTFIIGAGPWAGLASGEWFGDLPNLADWDRIVVATDSLGEALRMKQAMVKALEPEKAAEELRTIRDKLSAIRLQLAKVLATNGTVAAIVHLATSIAQYRKPISRGPLYVSSDEWLPVPFSRSHEPGDTLNVCDERLERYFQQVASWSDVFAVSDESCDLSNHLNLRVPDDAVFSREPLAKDRQGNAIGLKVRLQRKNGQASGAFSCFVPTTRVDDRKAVAILLDQLFGIQVDTPPPPWALEVRVYGEDSARSKVAAARAELETAQRVIQGLEEDISHLRQPVRILYEQHLSLQDACRDVFERMGITTIPSEISDEFVLKVGHREVLVEVKSKARGSAGLDHVGQLFRDMGDYLVKTGQPIKGLLVANVWADVSPSERETTDRCCFPQNVAEFAERHEIALLSTVELFRAYELVQAGQLSGSQVLETISATRGVVFVAKPK